MQFKIANFNMEMEDRGHIKPNMHQFILYRTTY